MAIQQGTKVCGRLGQQRPQLGSDLQVTADGAPQRGSVDQAGTQDIAVTLKSGLEHSAPFEVAGYSW